MSEPPWPIVSDGAIGGAPAPDGLQILPVTGLPEFRPGDNLAAAIAQAAPWIVDGDVLVVTSKVLSKTEGRLVPSPTDPEERDQFRRQLIDQETVRLVAQMGRTKIVENRLGLIAAAAGIDASNVKSDEIALLPTDPDASAAALVAAFAANGRRVGVIITDTQGRAWRGGVTDVAIGAAGLPVLDDHRGGVDEHGNHLVVTQVAIGDELAAAADLVKGKLSAVPVAVVRGMSAPGRNGHDGGGRRLIRPYEQDLFRLGTDLAIRQGRGDGAVIAAVDHELADTEVDPALVLDILGQATDLLPAAVTAAVQMRCSPDGRRVVAVANSTMAADITVAARAGAALQTIRGLLAAQGLSANWLDPAANSADLPDTERAIAGLVVGYPLSEPAASDELSAP